MNKAVRLQFLARMAWALALLSLFLNACEYQTLGNMSGTKSAPQGSSGAKAGPGIKSAPKPTATEANPIFCRLADLTPAATWNVTELGVSGSLTLTNYWPVTCTLSGEPKLGLTDNNGMDFYVQVSGPTPSPTRPSWKMKENTVAEVRFTWSNWCGLAPAGSMKVTVALFGQVEPALFVQVEDPNGSPLNITPPCEDKNQPSTLAVEGLRILN